MNWNYVAFVKKIHDLNKVYSDWFILCFDEKKNLFRKRKFNLNYFIILFSDMEVEEEEQRVAGALGVLAKVTNVRLVQNMLKAVSLADHDETTFIFKDAGFKVTTEDAK